MSESVEAVAPGDGGGAQEGAVWQGLPRGVGTARQQFRGEAVRADGSLLPRGAAVQVTNKGCHGGSGAPSPPSSFQSSVTSIQARFGTQSRARTAISPSVSQRQCSRPATLESMLHSAQSSLAPTHTRHRASVSQFSPYQSPTQRQLPRTHALPPRRLHCTPLLQLAPPRAAGSEASTLRRTGSRTEGAPETALDSPMSSTEVTLEARLPPGDSSHEGPAQPCRGGGRGGGAIGGGRCAAAAPGSHASRAHSVAKITVSSATRRRRGGSAALGSLGEASAAGMSPCKASSIRVDPRSATPTA